MTGQPEDPTPKRPAETCPKCRIPMNLHAEKPTEPRTAAEAEVAAQGLGAMIERVHQCPRCGSVATSREG